MIKTDEVLSALQDLVLKRVVIVYAMANDITQAPSDLARLD